MSALKDHVLTEGNGYQVIHWPERLDLSIADLWLRFPELVVGKYLVNTSYDSGFMTLSETQKENGWRMVGQLAHSPLIRDTKQIPHDQFDEWLVFDCPVQVEDFKTMVNYCRYSPTTFDLEDEWDTFWKQVLRLNPLHVLGENYGMYLVSRDKHLIQRVTDGNLRSQPGG